MNRLSRFGLALFVLALVLVPNALAQVPPLGPITINFTNSSSAATLCNVTAQNAGSFYMVGTVGPVDAQVSVDGVSWSTTNIITTAGAVQAQPLTPAVGTLYQIAPLAGGCVRVIADPTWSGQSAQVIMRAQAAVPNFGSGTITIPTPLSVSQGTTPWVVTTPVATPLATASPGLQPMAQVPFVGAYMHCQMPAGNTPNVTIGRSIASQCDSGGRLQVTDSAYGTTGATYQNNQCDQFVTSASITTAVSTKLITGVAGKPTYICLAAWQSTGTNATNPLQYQWGTTVTTGCDTGTNTLFPLAVTPGATANTWLIGWGGGVVVLAVANGMPPPAATPLIIPAGNDFCGVTSGTTNLGKFVVYYSQH